MHRLSPFCATLPRQSVAPLLLALLSACGGGGSSSEGTATSQSSSSATQRTTMSATSASSTSSTTLLSGHATASAVDSVYNAVAGAQGGAHAYAATAGHRSALAASDSTSFTLNCDQGGTATITISGGTLDTRLNGQLDAGERYQAVFSACKVQGGAVQLDGTVAMDVQSADTTGTAVQMSFTSLKATTGGNSTTLDGDALLQGTKTTSNGSTTTTAEIKATKLTLVTAWNSRAATLVLSDADLSWSTTWSGSVPTTSSLSGRYTVSGTVNDVTLSDTVAISGGVEFNSDGTPSSGSWTSKDSKATVKTSVSSNQVTIDVDDGNDGTTDHSWTLTLPQWGSSAG